MGRVVLTLCAALLLLPVVLKSRTSGNLPACTAFCVWSGGRIPVKVGGYVRRPGIYNVAANSMAESVIKMAEPVCQQEGFTRSSSAALPLRSGADIVLQNRPDGSLMLKVGRMTVPECLVLGIPLDISAMSEADFDRLPGIGPALARRITIYRQKNGGILHAGDLAAIEGIGEKKFKMLRPYFQPP